MSLKKAKTFLYKKKGYLKKSPAILAQRTGVSLEVAEQALKKVKLIIKGGPRIKRLFFDIETTPNIVYTWRTGWNLTIGPDSIIKERKVLSIHWKWAGSSKVHHLRWSKSQDDKVMLEKFIKIANQADELIGHNGDRFDIKWLRTRCFYHRIPMLPVFKTLDTLKKAKSQFYFNSNKLDYIAKFAKVGAKTPHEGYSLWLKCMDGDEDAMTKMLEYGDNDVIILEEVYNAMAPYITQNTHHGVLNGKEKTSCPNCAKEDSEHMKISVTPNGTIQRWMQCNCCKTSYKISNSKYLKL